MGVDMRSVWLCRKCRKKKRNQSWWFKTSKNHGALILCNKKAKRKRRKKGKTYHFPFMKLTWHSNMTLSQLHIFLQNLEKKENKNIKPYLTKFQFTRLGQDGPGKAQTRNLVHFHDSGTEVISPVNSCRLGKMHSSEATHRYIQNGSNAGIPVWSLGFPWADTPTSILSKCCRRAWAGAGSLPGLLSGRTLWWAHRGPWQQWAEEWP